MNPQSEFSQIYDKYIDKIYRFIFIKVNNQDTAEDLCSETFSRCWECFKQDANRIENIQAFLYQIARNIVTDHYRDKAKAQVVSADSVAMPDPRIDLEDASNSNSEVNNILSALKGLKQEYSDIIVHHYVNDLSIPEIAQTLNKSEGNVRVTLHRALKALKNQVKEA